jgi:hypothetical protein
MVLSSRVHLIEPVTGALHLMAVGTGSNQWMDVLMALPVRASQQIQRLQT